MPNPAAAPSGPSRFTIALIALLAFAVAGLVWFLKDDTSSAKTGAGRLATAAEAGGSASAAGSALAEATLSATTGFDVTTAAPAEVLDRALGTRDRLDRNHLLEKLGARLAAASPEEALAMLETIQARGDRDALMRGIAHVLSAGEPRKALALLKALKNDRDRTAGIMALVTEWKNGEIMTGGGRGPGGGGGMEFMMGFELARGESANPDLAAAFATEMLEGRGRAELLGQAARTLAEADPAAALKYAEGLEGDELARFQRSLAEGWAQSDPLGALGWAGGIADERARRDVQSQIFDEWSNRSPDDAKKFFATISDPAVREVAAREIADNTARKDRAGAELWAASLTNEAEQKAAWDAINRAAPLRTGLELRPGEGGLVVREVTQGGAAAATGQVKPNDTIVAVWDKDKNQFVAANNGGGREMYGLLGKGKAGETVPVQVVPAGSPAGTQPTVVELPRTVQTDEGGGGRRGDFRAGGGGPPQGGFGGGGPGGGRGGR